MRTGPRRGITLIELIIVVAIVGVLLAAAGTAFNFNGAATRQAAQAVGSAIDQARFEAIRTNNVAGFVVEQDAGGSGTVSICTDVDESVTLSCDTGSTREIIDLASGELERAVIASPTSVVVFFDRRGIVRNPASSNLIITITDRSGGNARTVTILPTGRTEID